MVDLLDRRYLAQCTQQLRSSALAGLLDLLLVNHPSELVERKGGDSYHIDFGTLSEPAYAEAREFIKKALNDDDDRGFSENERKLLKTIPSAKHVKPLEPIVSKLANGNHTSSSSSASKANGTNNQQIIIAPKTNSFPPVPSSFVATPTPVSTAELTPSLPYPSVSIRAGGLASSTDGTQEAKTAKTKRMTSFSPESTMSKQLKRTRLMNSEIQASTGKTRKGKGVRLPSPGDPVKSSASSTTSSSSASAIKKEKKKSKKDGHESSSRYYNGERVWRQAKEDLHFTFHGMDVILLRLEHVTKRPWVCGTCNKAFVSKDKVVNHVQQHSGEKIHECPTCHGKFSSKHYLKDHQKRVHLFHCHYCEEVFDIFDDLHNHSEQMHPDHADVKGCSCKKGCANSRCSCFKNGVNCTTHCQCLNCNNVH